MERARKFEVILTCAKSLVSNGMTMTFGDLAVWLNQRGFTTSYGTPYCLGGRGIARLVHAAYIYFRDELGLGDPGAATIAEAFTTHDGRFAHD